MFDLVLTNWVGICVGTDGLPGESEGGTGPHEEPSSDEQDTETCECRNCTSQIDLSTYFWMESE